MKMLCFPHYSRCIFALALLLLTHGETGSCLQAEELPAEQVEFFEAKIRPVLVEHCYECHNSLDAAEGGLAVDYRAAILKGGDSGAAIEPGKPDEGMLLPLLRHEIDGMEMPSGGPKLSEEVIADFEKWISWGAPDPRLEKPTAEALAAATSWEAVRERRKQWWSFQPITSPDVPQVTNQTWSSHPIDRFILSKLEEQGLTPTTPAAPHQLVRRLYFTLIGLPPTPDEANRWTARLQAASKEDRQQVTEELIDALMARPQFGEKWARHWMDWIRYAESHGSEGDPAIPDAWRYRDYLIRAWNGDVPYDQLVREHVAGDLLDNPRVNRELGINESAIGPAHWRMVFHGFSPTDALDERVRFTDDQINVFSKAFLGLTVSCARCHNHKFDPISQADYYALFGVLNSCRPGRTVIDFPEQRTKICNQLSELKQQIQHSLADEWLAELQRLPERLASRSPAKDKSSLLAPWSELQSAATAAEFTARWNELAQQHRSGKQPAGEAKVEWDLSQPDDYSEWFRGTESLPEQPHTAGEFAVATEGNRLLEGIYPSGVYSHLLSSRTAARLTSPDIELDQKYQLWIRAKGKGKAATRFAVQNYPRRGTLFPVQQLKPEWTWHRFDLAYWEGDSVHVELTTALDAPLLVNNEPSSWFGVTDVRVLPAGLPAPSSPDGLSVLFEHAGSKSPENLNELADLYRHVLETAVTDWNNGTLTDTQAELLDRALAAGLLTNNLKSSTHTASLVQQYRELEKQLKTPTRVPGLDETVGQDQPLYVRGNHKQPAEIIPRRFLEAIDAEPYQSDLSGRRELAEDLLRDDNPLTRRVIVNRLWLHLFGQGIVGTPDNFGRLGQEPTHPQLLDWLATEFSQNGWSLKQMIRLMVTSKTWQLDSTAAESALAADPDNKWLSHANVRRLEAEAIRDSMLSAAGVLDSQLYGPPVNGNAPRRSLYVRVIRNRLDPFLRSFDFPEPFSATGRRSATNVPAQSLMLMNDKQIRTAAGNWSRQILQQPDASAADRIQQMFLTVFGRPATDREAARATAFLQQAMQTRDQLRNDYASLQQQRTAREQAVNRLLAPVRSRLERSKDNPSATSAVESVAQPFAQWEFANGSDDTLQGLKGTLRGNAAIKEDGLVISPQGYLVTAPLQKTFREKTLEAWVQLDHLNQRGAGIMSLQSPEGRYFDAIVFGERHPLQWLAGSDHGRRTELFAGPHEEEATSRPVHLAIVYQKDGTIQGYRDGQPYGRAYKSNGPYEFKAGNAVIAFGVRHLPAGGNKMLSGRILRARLYDHALTSEQVRASFRTAPTVVTDQDVRDALTEADRNQLAQLEEQVADLDQQLERFQSVPATGEAAAWTDLAQALFTFQEFIYLQ